MLALYIGLLDVDFDVTETDAPELVAQLRRLSDRFTRAAG